MAWREKLSHNSWVHLKLIHLEWIFTSRPETAFTTALGLFVCILIQFAIFLKRRRRWFWHYFLYKILEGSDSNQVAFDFAGSFEWSRGDSNSKNDDSPSSISGGNPPTKTFRENLSPLSEPCEWGEERAGDPIGRLLLSMNPPDSSVWSSAHW